MPFRELPGAALCRFRKGEHIIRAGEPIEYIYYLTKGTVYREIVTDKGYESILSRKGGSGDVSSLLVGILAAYNRNSRSISSSDFVARTDCSAYKIPVEVCKEYLRQNPALLEDALYCAMDEYTRVLSLFQSRRDGNGMSRLCALLLERANASDDGLVVPRKCTNIEMSKLLSIHKVTVSRMLRALREEGTIEKSEKGLVILDPVRMKQYAENIQTLEYD